MRGFLIGVLKMLLGLLSIACFLTAVWYAGIVVLLAVGSAFEAGAHLIGWRCFQNCSQFESIYQSGAVGLPILVIGAVILSLCYSIGDGLWGGKK